MGEDCGTVLMPHEEASEDMTPTGIPQWIRQAWAFLDEIEQEYSVCSADKVVFLAATDKEVNIATMRFLPEYRIVNRISRYIIVHHEDDIEEYLSPDIASSCILLKKSADEIKHFIHLSSIQWVSDKVIINDVHDFFDANPYRLVGYKGISKADIVRLSFFDMAWADPDGSKSKQLPDIEYKAIDWVDDKVAEKFAECRGYGEIIDRLKEQGKLTDETEVILFALTETMKGVYASLKNRKIEAIVDNNPRQKSYNGTEIIRADGLIKYKGQDVRILVTSRWYKRICEQLRAIGFEYGREVFVVHDSYIKNINGRNSRRPLSEEIETGRRVYLSIRERFPSGLCLLEPLSGSGDAYLASIYRPDATVFICCSENCANIAATMGFKTILINDSEMSALVSYIRSETDSDLECKVVNCNYGQKIAERMAGYKGIDFNTFTQRTVYHDSRRRSAKRFKQRDSRYLFECNGFTEGRTAVLSPHSNLGGTLSDETWEYIAQYLKNEGYSVCTNVAGEERTIKGTIGLKIPYDIILDFVNRAGLFVGIRSGLCDILSSTTGRMIVLYTDQPASKAGSFYDFFSLKNMGLRTDDTDEYLITDEKDFREKFSI